MISVIFPFMERKGTDLLYCCHCKKTTKQVRGITDLWHCQGPICSYNARLKKSVAEKDKDNDDGTQRSECISSL